MSAIPQIKPELENPLYDQLMEHARGEANDHYLAVIVSSWLQKEGVLPQCLGLNPGEFRSLMQIHFPGFLVSEKVRKDEFFDDTRMPEREDLLKLFDGYRAYESASELWIAQILTAACLGANHLWQDLGLWNRNQLTELISLNFPRLASLNNKNMKWKKFLYKQLCSEEGIYVCRSPSCEVCADFEVCFGPEE